MSGNGNQVPMAPSRGPGPYPRAPTPHRVGVECYHPQGAAGSAYMPSTAAGAQGPAQTNLRAQQPPQPSAPPAQQSDMSKTTMAGHNYVQQQNQTQQHARPQFPGYQYRATQHGSRPNAHPRQQQPYIPGGAATAAGGHTPVVYHPALLYQPAHIGIPQSYQPPRTRGYYQYVTPYLSYSTPASHTTPYPYYPSNGQQIPSANMPANTSGARNNPTTMVGPPVTQTTPTAPTPFMPHQPTPPHVSMQGTRQVPFKRSHRVPIIDPSTNQEIFSEMYSSGSQNYSGESSERQTPQPQEAVPHGNSIAEEFTRMVSEVANQSTVCESNTKTNNVPKNVEIPVSSSSSATQPQTNAITSNNNNIVKSEIVTINDKKSLASELAVNDNEPPVVSALSDSPVIVPKMTMSCKLPQKSSEQSIVLDTNKNLTSKVQKQNKNTIKPVVPQEHIEKLCDSPAPVTQTQVQIPPFSSAPQPQRVPRERLRSEDKAHSVDKDVPPVITKTNGPIPTEAVSSANTTSQISQTSTESNNKSVVLKQVTLALEPDITEACETKSEITKSESSNIAAHELLSASIEKHAKEPDTVTEVTETSSAIQAQAKLTQSLNICHRSNLTESKMKDINLNNKTTDPDAANGNSEMAKTEPLKDNTNKNEKAVKNSKNANKKSANKMANDTKAKEVELCENGKEETELENNAEEDNPTSKKEDSPQPMVDKADAPAAPVFVPKYKYSDDQWSPLNTSGKKCYDINLLKQIKDDPLSKNKPNVPILETLNVIRTTPMQETISFTPVLRPMTDSLLPNFLKGTGGGGGGTLSRNSTSRDAKKDGRSMLSSGSKGSVKLSPAPGSHNKPVIHVSLSLREDVKLNETENAWKPSRFNRKVDVDAEEIKTQELYKKFRGILNKLTPQKFDTLLDRVKTLEIDNRKRLEGIIDLVFEKAIDEPNFSEAYAAMCKKLSTLKVPADNATAPDHYVNFRGLIITRCQNQFMTYKADDHVLNLEKEVAECTDNVKKKEMQLQLEEEYRRLRMRSVGNVRFIGELYKLKIISSKIMVYCMNTLIEKLEEEKLECLCKLLTTIGEQVESEFKDELDTVFKKMQDIVNRKSNKISSRVRFMLQDVIELRRRRWVVKSVIDSQPKMMDQIQKEAEQQQRNIEIMNATPMGGFRRDDGGRNKRGDNRRGGQNTFMDNTWKTRSTFVVDSNKLKAVSNSGKSLSNIKLAPHSSVWNQGSGTKNLAPVNNPMISFSKNQFSALENVQSDPITIRGNKEMSPAYHAKSASIGERSNFNSRGDFNSGNGSRSGAISASRSNSSSRNAAPVPVAVPVPAEAPAPKPTTIAQEPLPSDKKNFVKSTIDISLINPDDHNVLANEVEELFPPQYHAALVTEILYNVFERTVKEIGIIAKALLHLVSTNTISAENFVAGISEIFEFAPDMYIDIPMLYEYLSKFIAPHIENKQVTFTQLFKFCSNNIIASNHGHLILKAIIRDLKDSMGPSFVKSKWQESGLELKQWMDEDQVLEWIEDNKFEFLKGGVRVADETKKNLTPLETQAKLLQLMNSDENCDCIKGWVQDNLGKTANEDWFMRALIQAICEHALFGPEGRDVPQLNHDRMNKYIALINDFGESRAEREASCLFGIQQLITRLEHPRGLTLELFQFLNEQYLISIEGFIAWEESEKEPEGKGVMMKALTSFYTDIKEADNEDSCSED